MELSRCRRAPLALIAAAGLALSADAQVVQTYTDGVADGCSTSGVEPATPSPGLVLWTGTGLVEPNFDGTQVNRHFVETIDGFPTPVLSATIRFNMRPNNSAATDDLVALQFTDSNGTLVGERWSRSIGDIGSINGLVDGLWTTSNFGCTTFEFDLSALPPADSGDPPFNLLDDLNQFGYIDLHVQDNTRVDYFEIEVTLATENEPCGGSTNDDVASTEQITVPAYVLGSIYADAGTTDTDWFSFASPGLQSIDARVDTSGPVSVMVYGPASGPSAGPLLLAGVADLSDPFSGLPYLDASGSYSVHLEGDVTSGFPCPTPIDYVLQLDTEPCDLEGEGCTIGLFNDGCALFTYTCGSANAGFDPIVVGDRICGTVSSDATLTIVDEDWFDFSATGGTVTQWTMHADFDFLMEVVDLTAGCPGTIIDSFARNAGAYEFESWVPGGCFGVRVVPTEASRDCLFNNQGTYTLEFAESFSNPVDASITIESVQPGEWSDANTWNVGVPGPANTVVVNHAVHMADSTPAPDVEVRNLTIDTGGTLRATPLGDDSSASLLVNVGDLTVEPGGALLAGDGNSEKNGGDLNIVAEFNESGTFTNRGYVGAGFGRRGGNVVVRLPGYDVVNETAALMIGGIPSGDLSVIADSFTNDGGAVSTGATDANFPHGGRFTIRSTDSSRNINGGLIVSPSASFSGFPSFRNFFTGFNLVQVDATSAIDCEISSGRWLCIAGRLIDIQGTIEASRMCFDPPDLIFSGDVQINTKESVIAGEFLRFGPLNNTNAITGEDELTIMTNPGGFLDLRFLSNANYFSSNGPITIKSDNILTPPGVSVQDLFEPDPTILPGEFLYELCTSPGDSELSVDPGEALTRFFTVQNCGSTGMEVDVSLSDTAGWLTTPFSVSGRSLTILEDLSLHAVMQVPDTANPGDTTVVSFIVTEPNASITRQTDLTLIVAGCLADWTGDSILNTADVIAFLNDYNAAINGQPTTHGDPDLAAPTGVLNTADVIAFFNAFAAGCS